MSTGLVIHVVAGFDKHTEVINAERIRIGSSEDCNLRLSNELLAGSPNASGVLLELTKSNGHYRIRDFDPSVTITHNGERLTKNSRIGDGDELRIDQSNLLLTFFPIGDVPALVQGSRTDTHVAPFIEHAAIESAATARRDDAKVFLREFTRELIREINPSTKIVSLALVLILVTGVLYLGYSIFREMRDSRRLINDQKTEISKVNEIINQTNDEIRALDEANKRILYDLSLAVKLRNEYGEGVSLIFGTYYFVDRPSGRALRYPEDQTNEDGSLIQSGNEPMELTPEGNGPIYEREFVGSGFHVGNGYILTNRHVAQPWLADEGLAGLTGSGSRQPRLKRLVAFFPNRREPITLRFRQASTRDDLAVCTLDIKEVPTDIAALPLDSSLDAIEIGKKVVMMGYPNGPERFLAMLEDAERRSVQARFGASLESLLGFLSESKRIQPLTTQGYITDLDARRLVYDAPTAEGGSGAPVFGPSGKVVGVNFAVFTENTASNFAVPIKYAITLLEKLDWKPVSAESLVENPVQTPQRTAQSGR